LAAGGTHGLPVSAVAKDLGLPRSSTANICASLESAGLIVRAGSHYRLGPRLLELGSRYLSGIDLVRHFYDLCESSPHVSGETGRLALLDRADVLYLARYDGTQPLRLTSSIGDRYPASVTATGKAMLSTRSADDVGARLAATTTPLPRLTDKSISSIGALMIELEVTRQRGWAIDDEETTPGVCCLAVPVVERPAEPAAYAVSVTLEKPRLTVDMRTRLLSDLQRIAAGLTTPLHPHVRRSRREE